MNILMTGLSDPTVLVDNIKDTTLQMIGHKKISSMLYFVIDLSVFIYLQYFDLRNIVYIYFLYYFSIELM